MPQKIAVTLTLSLTDADLLLTLTTASRLQDPDLAVRAAVVEATVTVAANLEALSGSPAPGDAPSNPLLRDVFDGLTDTNTAVQHTAAACLVQVIEAPMFRAVLSVWAAPVLP